VRNIDPGWGIRNVSVEGGKTRDIPLPAAVTRYLQTSQDRITAVERCRAHCRGGGLLASLERRQHSALRPAADPGLRRLARDVICQTPTRNAAGADATGAVHHCASCHRPDLSGQQQEARLAGQDFDYLLRLCGVSRRRPRRTWTGP
jgi:hypothetical protein